ncbi:MAG: type II toxin-antitoxin system VapC family toxin [Acidobacteriota bacterium]
MILDTSAVIAILRGEAEAQRFSAIVERSNAPKMSVASYVEAGAVVDAAKNPVVSRTLDEFLRVAGVALQPVTVEQGQLAREAYRDFGRGSGHPAQLNFGDCFAYALAKALGEPLLFKGDDFSRTDVERAGDSS